MPRRPRGALHNARSFSWTLNRRYLSMYMPVVPPLSNDLISRRNGRGREGLADGITCEKSCASVTSETGENIHSANVGKNCEVVDARRFLSTLKVEETIVPPFVSQLFTWFYIAKLRVAR